jgi:hypothetical protein
MAIRYFEWRERAGYGSTSDCSDFAASPGEVPEPPMDGPYTPRSCSQLLDVAVGWVDTVVESYLTQTCRRYLKRGILHWEVCNELDLNDYYRNRKQYRGDWPIAFSYSPEVYVELLAKTRAVLRGLDADVRILCAGLADQSSLRRGKPTWYHCLQQVLAAGGGQYIDVYHFHFYTGYAQQGPIEWARIKTEIEEIQALLEEYDAPRRTLWMTETGKWSDQETVNQEVQASQLVKRLAVAFANGVEVVNWHPFNKLDTSTEDDDEKGYADRSLFSPDPEDGFARRKGWYAYRMFSRFLGNFGECAAVCEGEASAATAYRPGAWVYRFTGQLYESDPEPEPMWVLWSDGGGVFFNLESDSHFDAGLAYFVQSFVVDDDQKHHLERLESAFVPLSSQPVLVYARKGIASEDGLELGPNLLGKVTTDDFGLEVDVSFARRRFVSAGGGEDGTLSLEPDFSRAERPFVTPEHAPVELKPGEDAKGLMLEPDGSQ